jgi:hypothetical protein
VVGGVNANEIEQNKQTAEICPEIMANFDSRQVGAVKVCRRSENGIGEKGLQSGNRKIETETESIDFSNSNGSISFSK